MSVEQLRRESHPLEMGCVLVVGVRVWGHFTEETQADLGSFGW